MSCTVCVHSALCIGHKAYECRSKQTSNNTNNINPGDFSEGEFRDRFKGNKNQHHIFQGKYNYCRKYGHNRKYCFEKQENADKRSSG